MGRSKKDMTALVAGALTLEQQIVADLLAAGTPIEKVCAQVEGVTKHKIRAWKGRSKAFQAAIEQYQQEQIHHVQGAWLSLLPEALKVLAETMTMAEDERLRFDAAMALLGRFNLQGGDAAAKSSPDVAVQVNLGGREVSVDELRAEVLRRGLAAPSVVEHVPVDDDASDPE